MMLVTTSCTESPNTLSNNFASTVIGIINLLSIMRGVMKSKTPNIDGMRNINIFRIDDVVIIF
ncbi:hypothetical protein BTN50_0462 [Candidatus Enterovibrio altilux]|uniref:Uncharacterized protein n=1 Tax=Candidatus Enterovibrio altilux TaxID=1927128 RepID=A0A291B7L7_9GAMM|nr:hypothetical protein BTN50_0462 [Candidatus Enterovibrio luxaltus]